MNEPTSCLDEAKQQEIDSAVSRLASSGPGDLNQRLAWIEACLPRLQRSAADWVALSCAHKGIAAEQAIAAEEILAGPVVVMRFFRLVRQTLLDLQSHGRPRLPGRPRRGLSGAWHVPVFPAAGFYDALLFPGISAQVRMAPAVERDGLFSETVASAPWIHRESSRQKPVTLVLGAGNVSAIPVTDCATKILCDGEPVLLKLNPVNAYLRPVWDEALRPLVDANQLQIVEGGPDAGAYAAHHPQVTAVHITGSHRTHDALVWGDDSALAAERKRQHEPLLNKPITSELGNVTPWVVVPGQYSDSQLRSQAEHVAASLVNNAGYNCLATRVMITARNWPQRKAFLELVREFLQGIPPRRAYYPGARDRFASFTGLSPHSADETLPWTFLCDVDPRHDPHYFEQESFVCICVETALDASSDRAFLEQAVRFCNDRLFGTLCAVLTVPNGFRRRHAIELEHALDQLRYGTVSLNQWPGTAYGIMTTPWGAYPGGSLAEIQSGLGSVHNTYLLRNYDKAVLRAPLRTLTHPVWFPSHRRAADVAWRLLRLYRDPRLLQIPGILWAALRA